MRKDWIECEAELLGDLIRGINYKKPQSADSQKNNFLPILRANNINENQLNFENLKYVEKELIKEDQKILAGDIIFAMSSGSKHLVGKSGQAKINYNGSFGAFCSVFRPNENINSKFIQCYFHSTTFRGIISKASKGSNINNLKREHILNATIPLPPLITQKAIVKKIEELFSSLDSGIADLKKAQDQLVIYRQAVLNKAYNNITKETTLEDVKKDSLIGLVRASGLQNNSEIGLPYIKMDKIDMIGNVNLTELVYVEVNKVEEEKYQLNSGDILLNTRNSFELVGKTGIMRNIKKTMVFNNNIMRIRVKDEYNPYFICYQLISPFVRKQMDGHKKATTSVCALYQRNLFPLKLKTISLNKQNQIVREIESRLSVCDKVEESIKESLQKAQALRQSILKKAFEGKLLSEEGIAKCKADKDYEPARVLLERIKVEKKKITKK
tara:strand:- start:8094 stop:9416 length:1323 start_codon:yes stop_codon:yes gene_type:complete